jgi:DNA (cytosine-5)-methyltransferase 1
LADFAKWGREDSNLRGLPAVEPYGLSANLGKPRLLDLFCGAGGAAMGYHRAGFEVVGVDIKPQPNYPFGFVRDDALALMSTWIASVRGWWDEPPFDAIHASPPCQAYSVVTRDKTDHAELVHPVRELLIATGLPYVIENVPGAPLIDPVTICGSSLGLKVRRHRLFETNWPLMVPPCAHKLQGTPVGVYGEGSAKGQKRGRKASSEGEVLEVMGMPWADRKTATQAIPPAYTELIGYQLLTHLEARKAA